VGPDWASSGKLPFLRGSPALCDGLISHKASLTPFHSRGYCRLFVCLMHYRSWRINLSFRRFASRADQDVQIARDWLKSLNAKTVPRHICEVSFSRSSGPGGQNVNKSVTPLEDQHVAIADRDLKGKLQSHLEGSTGLVVALGAPVGTSTATRFPISCRKNPIASHSI
jgi:hypothetical protein